MKNWNDFDKFSPAIDKYMPDRGEGETMASQLCTAVNKLVYKWYNDGDVYDNIGYLDGWCNDLSSYANWIYKQLPSICNLMESVTECGESEYEDLLYRLASHVLNEGFLKILNKRKKQKVFITAMDRSVLTNMRIMTRRVMSGECLEIVHSIDFLQSSRCARKIT